MTSLREIPGELLTGSEYRDQRATTTGINRVVVETSTTEAKEAITTTRCEEQRLDFDCSTGEQTVDSKYFHTEDIAWTSGARGTEEP